MSLKPDSSNSSNVSQPLTHDEWAFIASMRVASDVYAPYQKHEIDGLIAIIDKLVGMLTKPQADALTPEPAAAVDDAPYPAGQYPVFNPGDRVLTSDGSGTVMHGYSNYKVQIDDWGRWWYPAVELSLYYDQPQSIVNLYWWLEDDKEPFQASTDDEMIWQMCQGPFDTKDEALAAQSRRTYSPDDDLLDPALAAQGFTAQVTAVAILSDKVEPETLGPQEPPDDPMIFNRKQADGSYRPLAEFFDGDKAQPAHLANHQIVADSSPAPKVEPQPAKLSKAQRELLQALVNGATIRRGWSVAIWRHNGKAISPKTVTACADRRWITFYTDYISDRRYEIMRITDAGRAALGVQS